MPPFQPGYDPNRNYNGRPPGSKNRISEQLKEAFALLLENNLEQYEIWLAQVAEDDPARALELALKISERFIPIMSRTELTSADGGDLFSNVKFDFGNPTPEPDQNFDIDNING